MNIQAPFEAILSSFNWSENHRAGHRRRRQHVMPLPKPSSCGRSSHGIPVRSTYRMPLSAARSSTVRRRPPLRRGSELRDQRFQRHPQLIADFASCHAADDTTFAASPLGCVSDSNTTIGRSHHLLRCGTGTRLVSFFASPGSMPPRREALLVSEVWYVLNQQKYQQILRLSLSKVW